MAWANGMEPAINFKKIQQLWQTHEYSEYKPSALKKHIPTKYIKPPIFSSDIPLNSCPIVTINIDGPRKQKSITQSCDLFYSNSHLIPLQCTIGFPGICTVRGISAK